VVSARQRCRVADSARFDFRPNPAEYHQVEIISDLGVLFEALAESGRSLPPFAQ
jgi:hypothetical protein